MIKDIVAALLPAFFTFAMAAIPVLLGLALERFRTWTGIAIEANHRAALQSALANAARIVFAGATKRAGYDYVLASVPDALKAFKIAHEDRIEELLQPHLDALKAGAK